MVTCEWIEGNIHKTSNVDLSIHTIEMPFFTKSPSQPEPEKSKSPQSNSFFSRSSQSPPAPKRGTNSTSPRRGFFGRHGSSLNRQNGTTRSARTNNNGGFFSMGNNHGKDPTILAARQKVTDAEAAEKEADRALMQARAMVQEAREHVKILEREASEDARRAKAKQAEAKLVSKTASGLGRHG
ncbi:hypothetical protein BD779DRAFT_1506321 [Infundibulicybe gibba]|nr:hypothetical protein BD779DRAFT_1506321 [Infundibulicybe gibba]